MMLTVFSFFWAGAQDGSYSPYSYYKFGEEVDAQAVENLSMGHLNFYNDSTHFNFELPSSLANLRLVNYAVATTFDYYRIRSTDGFGAAGEFVVPYISLGIPVGNKAGIGFGFKPYSTSAYLIIQEPENEKIAKTGEGGLNRVFVAAGMKIFKGLNAGISFNYYFGSKIARFIHYQDDVYTITRQVDNSFYEGTGWNFSLDYTRNFDKRRYFQAGINYRLDSYLTSQNTSELELSDNTFGWERIVQTLTLREDTTTVLLPNSLSIGVGFGQKKKWFAGAEWETTAWDRYENDFFTAPFVSYRRSQTFKAGGYWIPDARPHVFYLKRITYKAGFYYKEGELVFDNQPVNEFGITFGLSLPVSQRFSNINLGWEYVHRGEATLITTEENIWKFKVGLSFNDRWFIKRKIK